MKKNLAVLLVLGALLLAGCSQQPSSNGQLDTNQNTVALTGGVDSMQTVENGDTLKVEYVGTFEDGNVFDKSEGRGPLEFTAGAGQMIKGFDEAVIGMKVNDEKNITLGADKAYGEAREDAFVWTPKTQLPQDGNITIGTQLMASNGMPVLIVDMNADSVKIDFNHPLAGKTLKFWLKVVQIVKATK